MINTRINQSADTATLDPPEIAFGMGDPPAQSISRRLRAGLTTNGGLLSHAVTGTSEAHKDGAINVHYGKLDPGQSPLSVTPAKLKELRDRPVYRATGPDIVAHHTPDPSQYDAHADDPSSDIAHASTDTGPNQPSAVHENSNEDAKPGWADWLFTGLAVAGAVAAVVFLPEVAPFAIALAAHAVTQVVVRHKGNYLTSPSGLMAGVVTAAGAQMMFSGMPALGATIVSAGIAMSNEHVVKIVKEVGKDTTRLIHGSVRIVDYFSKYPWLIPILGVIIAVLMYRQSIQTFLNRKVEKLKSETRNISQRAKTSAAKAVSVIKTPRHLPFWSRSGAMVN